MEPIPVDTIAGALDAWEDAVLNAHCGDAMKNPLHTTAILILAGDKLAEIIRDEHLEE